MCIYVTLIKICFLRGSCAATRESIEWLLTKKGKGNALIIAVGGAAEAMEAHPGDVSLTLKSRKGFVRHALIHGASLASIRFW
ncbi:unnamed protein product [Larinioides sclopetarius]|uniref:diacylglycerol O-acyltransferase n=1 Tax=Larinioides sclopetarius TaxID=280406 RepID=A0AAV1Z8U8_9ARAC